MYIPIRAIAFELVGLFFSPGRDGCVVSCAGKKFCFSGVGEARLVYWGWGGEEGVLGLWGCGGGLLLGVIFVGGVVLEVLVQCLDVW